MEVRHAFEVVRPCLASDIERINARYADGMVAEDKEKAFLAEIGRREGLQWKPGEEAIYGPITQAAYEAASEVELLSERVLLQLDGIATSITVMLTLEEYVVGCGPVLYGGVRLDAALDAAANYVRHKSEWIRVRNDRAAFTPKQMTSIRNLARLLTDDVTIDGDAAVAAVLDAPMPMFAVLDMIADYEHHGVTTIDVVEERLLTLSNDIVDQEFKEWAKDPLTKKSER